MRKTKGLPWLGNAQGDCVVLTWGKIRWQSWVEWVQLLWGLMGKEWLALEDGEIESAEVLGRNWVSS